MLIPERWDSFFFGAAELGRSNAGTLSRRLSLDEKCYCSSCGCFGVYLGK